MVMLNVRLAGARQSIRIKTAFMEAILRCDVAYFDDHGKKGGYPHPPALGVVLPETNPVCTMST
jgi:hypothetical protein